MITAVSVKLLLKSLKFYSNVEETLKNLRLTVR